MTFRALALLLAASTCAAQYAPMIAPVVPADHFGPPSCIAGTAPAPTDPSRPSAAKLLAEQQAAAADPTNLVAAETLENFAAARFRLADYADCIPGAGCYWADLDAQFRRAEAALDMAMHNMAVDTAHHAKAHKLAIVLDIDETSLSSYCEMKREDFGFISAMSNDWVVKPEAAVAIPGAVRLFRRARSLGLAVFFITGRPEAQTEATARNLRAAGFDTWEGLALRNAAERSMPTAAYKSGRRQQIIDRGFRIVLSVGDQWSDLNGTPRAEINVKLPNPFYFLPSS